MIATACARILGAALIAAASISIAPQTVQASNEATLFPFRSHMPGEGNCEGAAWKAGEKLGNYAYASWDARKGRIWIGIGGKVYQSSYQRTQAGRVTIVEADVNNMHVIITIPRQVTHNSNSYPNGTLEILSNSSNQSHGRINVTIGEAC